MGNPEDRFSCDVSGLKAASVSQSTIKFLNFQTQENFAVIYLKLKQKGFRVFSQKYANGIANSEDPDQTAPLGAV